MKNENVVAISGRVTTTMRTRLSGVVTHVDISSLRIASVQSIRDEFFDDRGEW